jgi:hypothetical protein
MLIKGKPFLLEFAEMKFTLEKFSNIIWGFSVEIETDCQAIRDVMLNDKLDENHTQWLYITVPTGFIGLLLDSSESLWSPSLRSPCGLHIKSSDSPQSPPGVYEDSMLFLDFLYEVILLSIKTLYILIFPEFYDKSLLCFISYSSSISQSH